MRRFSIFLLFILAASLPSLASADVTWAAGAPGGTSGTSINFDNSADGSGLFLDTGISGADLASDYTISLWINANTLSNPDQGSWFLGTGNQGLHLGVRSTDTPPVTSPLAQGHWGADSAGTSEILVNNWYHATFTYDADGGTGGTTGLQSIYLDGALQNQADNGSVNNTSTNIILGARNNGNNGPQWDGQLDDVAIWNSVISGADITAIAGGTAANTLGAQAYWDFENDTAGTTALQTGAGGLGATDLTGITANAVPEPSSLAFMLGLGALGFARRKRN